MHSKNNRGAVDAEDLVGKLQADLDLDRSQVLLLMADTLASALLATSQGTLHKMFSRQGNRLPYRRLQSVLDTLQKLGFLNFRN